MNWKHWTPEQRRQIVPLTLISMAGAIALVLMGSDWYLLLVFGALWLAIFFLPQFRRPVNPESEMFFGRKLTAIEQALVQAAIIAPIAAVSALIAGSGLVSALVTGLVIFTMLLVIGYLTARRKARTETS